MADGYMHHDKHYKISFSSNDYAHLEDIKKAVGSNTKLYREKKDGEYINCYDLCLYSKKIFFDIMKLGGKTRKSNTLEFPEIPRNLLPDFIRGYFDGDGSLFVVSYKATKNGKVYHELRSNFTSGNKKFIEAIRKNLADEIGLPLKIIGQYGPHQFKLGYGTKNTIKLIKYLYYPGHKLSLGRKANFIRIHNIEQYYKKSRSRVLYQLLHKSF